MSNGNADARLWIVRTIEGQLGLSALLAERSDVSLLASWLATAAVLDTEIDQLCADPDPEKARRLFFTSQAYMEKFVIERISYAAMDEWTQFSALIHRQLNVMDDPHEQFPLRLRDQLDLYESDVSATRGGVSVNRCGIWTYREMRRAAGTPITLESPCEFCTLSVIANARQQHLEARVELLETASGHGCEWVFS